VCRVSSSSTTSAETVYSIVGGCPRCRIRMWFVLFFASLVLVPSITSWRFLCHQVESCEKLRRWASSEPWCANPEECRYYINVSQVWPFALAAGVCLLFLNCCADALIVTRFVLGGSTRLGKLAAAGRCVRSVTPRNPSCRSATELQQRDAGSVRGRINAQKWSLAAINEHESA